MGIAKELSWLVYPGMVDGIRHVDTDILQQLMDAKTNLLVERTAMLKANEDALAQKSGALDSCLNAMSASGDACQVKLAKMQDDLITANSRLSSMQDDFATLNDSLSACKLGRDKPPLPQATLDKLNSYYTKYPEAYITSDAHYIGLDKTPVSYPVQDWCLIGSNCLELIDHIRKNNCFVYDIMKKETNGDFHKACDIARARIKITKPFKYAWDSVKYGVDDFWQFAHETFKTAKPPYKGEGDCDDGDAEEEVLCEISGIPRAMRRSACGWTRGSHEGHSTNFYFASDWTWRHINSTTNYDDSYKTATQFPLENDSSDPMGLSSVWYSFNADKSWQGFPSPAARDEFEKAKDHRLMKHIKIVPLMRGGGA